MSGGLTQNPLYGEVYTPDVIPGADNQSRAGDIMDALNRQADQLDTFNDKLSFQANGQFNFTWDGTVKSDIQSFQHGLNYAPIFLAYYNISTDGNKWYPCDDLRADTGGLVTLEFYFSSDTNYLFASYNALAAGVGATITFKWFLLKEPAQATT